MDQQSRRQRFDDLFANHFPAVMAYARRRVRHGEDAADVASDTFLVAWRRLQDVPDGPDERVWLLGAARKVLANQRRGARRRDALWERLRGEAAVAAPAEAADSTEVLVHQALAALRPRDREIIALTVWDGLEPSQAAAVMGVPAATARTRLRRARTRLQAELAARGWDIGEAEAEPAAPAPAVNMREASS